MACRVARGVLSSKPLGLRCCWPPAAFSCAACGPHVSRARAWSPRLSRRSCATSAAKDTGDRRPAESASLLLTQATGTSSHSIALKSLLGDGRPLSDLGISEEDVELLESLDAAVVSLGQEATDDHPIVEARNKIFTAYRDKAALLKRDWTDEMFQDGEDMNEERVAEIESKLAAGLHVSGGGLADGGNLGAALDLVGVYMKNYKLDKADSVLSRCAPFVSQRGGVWNIKWLNHTSTVRMKQGRHLEALEMLYELELHSPYSPEEAPQFFETVYRNLAWALKALGRIDEAGVYFAKMAQSSHDHKGHLDWFDHWDVGKLKATHAFRDRDMPRFYEGRSMVEQALQMQIEAEPEDLVMRAKVHDSLAECYFVVQEYDQAEKHYMAAYSLLQQTVGSQSPLFGKQAKHVGSLHITRGQHEVALPFLGEALAVEASKDAPKLHELVDIVDLIVGAQQRSSTELVAPSCHSSLKALRANLEGRGLGDSREFGVLCHKMSLLYLHEIRRDPKALKRAVRLAKQSVRLLRAHSGSKEAGDWLRMAEIHLRMLLSARSREQQHT